jgi:hypothetical protein
MFPDVKVFYKLTVSVSVDKVTGDVEGYPMMNATV